MAPLCLDCSVSAANSIYDEAGSAMPRKAKRSAAGPDNPEWIKAYFARAAKLPAGVRLKDLKPGELVRMVGKRGAKAPAKKAG